MNDIFLIIGGNLGNKEKNLATARNLIGQKTGIVKKLSAIYQTEAWGVLNQPVYYNQIIEILTEMNAGELMKSLLSIEQQMGRIRNERFGARTIDIDILFFNDEIHNTQDVTIPHPRLQERRFVLEPLHEIAPEFVHPVFQKTVAELLNELNDNTAVKKLVGN